MKILPNPTLKPSHIFVRDEIGIQKKLSIIEAEKLFNIEWLEWESTPYSIIKSSDSLSILEQVVPGEILEKVEVRYMGDKYKWGLFAKEDILKGTVIGLFTGTFNLQEKHVPIKSEHVFSFDTTENKLGVIDATTCGNITRFLQDLPKKDEIDDLKFDTSIEITDIAIENVEVVIVLIGENLETNLFVASKNIKASEIIGCHYTPYDSTLWQKIEHSFFLKDGTPVLPISLNKEYGATKAQQYPEAINFQFNASKINLSPTFINPLQDVIYSESSIYTPTENVETNMIKRTSYK